MSMTLEQVSAKLREQAEFARVIGWPMTKTQCLELADAIDAHAVVSPVVTEVLLELERAMKKFPTWPDDPLHAVGVLNEEVGELNKAVLQQMYEPHKNAPGAVRSEAVQAAAMALRFIASIDRYDWTPGSQHEQPALAAAPSPGESE
jgi:hypothetical protein